MASWDLWNPDVDYNGDVAYWNMQSFNPGTTLHADATDIEGRKCMLVFTRSTPAGTREDAAIISFYFVKVTAGAIVPWTSGADVTTVEGFLNAWWTTVKGSISTTATLKEFRWYRFGNRYSRRHVGSGPPNKVTAVGTAGSASSGTALPYQVSMSVTFKTASRKHWGRVYIPNLDSGNLGTQGRLGVGMMTSVATATATLMTSAQGAGLPLVVFSRPADARTLKNGDVMPAHDAAVLNPISLQIDDIPDVIQRRRPKQKLAVQTRP